MPTPQALGKTSALVLLRVRKEVGRSGIKGITV